MKTESGRPIVGQAVQASSGTPSIEAGVCHPRSAGRWRSIAAGAWLAFGLSSGLAQPAVNGLFYMDGDNNQYPATPYAQSAAGSKLYVRLVDGKLYVALVVARAVNDNVFATSADGAYLTSADWGPGNNKTARRRMDSEFATFTLTVAGTSWTWLQGYCGQPGYGAGYGDRSQPNWISGVTVSGGLGTPPPSYVAASSLAWNLNRYATGPNLWNMPGTDLNTASWKAPWLNAGEGAPGENPNTVIDPTEGYPATGQLTYSPTYNWEWSMIYEWSVDFTDPAFGNVGSSPIYVVTGASHHSPGKNGEENDPLTPTDPSPMRDFGDLPAPYPTLLADNGPRHILDIAGARLGSSLDNELNGLPHAKALGDDSDGADDEDGVQLLTPLIPGQTAVVRVTVGGANGYLSAFIDWDGNGTLDPVTLVSATGPTPLTAGVIGDRAVSPGTYDLTISVPANATGAMPSRWRITNAATQGGNSPTGEASSGEVEDHIFLAAIGNYVWNDINDDGLVTNTPDLTEEPIAGVLLELWRMDEVGEFQNTGLTTTSSETGEYWFTGLFPGTYRVRIPTPPAAKGWSSHTTSTADDGVDNDDNGIQANGIGQPVVSPAIQLSPGETDNTVDFGFLDPAVGNLVWNDLDADGRVDDGEPGIAGVVLELYRVGDGGARTPYPYNTDGTSTTTTDADGFYIFGGLPPGNYQIDIPESNFASGGALYNTPSSTSPTVNADNQIDEDDNGMQSSAGGRTVSPVINLLEDVEPTDANSETGRGKEMDNSPLEDLDGDMTVDFGFTSSTPTAAVLDYFRAVRSGGSGVTLQWGTLVESRVLGFRLNRAGADGLWVTVTPSIIAAHAGLSQPGAYRFTDPSAAGAVRYQLVAVNLRGDDLVLAETDIRTALDLRSEVADGLLRIEFHGTPYGQAILETSTDPARGPWEAVETVALDAQGIAGLTRALEGHESARFFRLRE